MATGSILCSIASAILPDGSATNLAPAIQRVKSSGTAPAPYFLQAAFDAAALEWCCWSLRMPATYASAPVAKLQYKMASATSGNVILVASLAAVSDGDSTDVDAKVFATVNTSSATAVPGTAGYLDEVSLSLANADSVAAGDFVVLRVGRDGASGSDTATGDLELIAVTLEFTV